jgi:hypothetical protein
MSKIFELSDDLYIMLLKEIKVCLEREKREYLNLKSSAVIIDSERHNNHLNNQIKIIKDWEELYSVLLMAS